MFGVVAYLAVMGFVIYMTRKSKSDPIDVSKYPMKRTDLVECIGDEGDDGDGD
ncbi:hypothetical protein [Ectobacillus funiculus]|uniref:CcoQ/FixQ family Cbb3-type cytochrome c oxidase assembly chaperone n=1 Tax=Ectobacillus funiculus TaxID=137993 RepID=A0ABV5WJ70_9BACI